jgi:hypothetical protein
MYLFKRIYKKSMKSLIPFQSLGAHPKQIKILEPSCGSNAAHLKPPVRRNFHCNAFYLGVREGKACNFATTRRGGLQEPDSSAA